jgi:hypothetical protein
MAKVLFANLILLANDDSIQAEIYSKVTGIPIQILQQSRFMHIENDQTYGKGRWIESSVLETFMGSVRDVTLLSIAERALRKLGLYREHKKRKYTLDRLRSGVQAMVIEPILFRFLSLNIFQFVESSKLWTPADRTSGISDGITYNILSLIGIDPIYAFQCQFFRLDPLSIFYVKSGTVMESNELSLFKIAIKSARDRSIPDAVVLDTLYNHIKDHRFAIVRDNIDHDKIMKEFIAMEGYYGLKHLGRIRNYANDIDVVKSALKSNCKAMQFVDQKLALEHPELLEEAMFQCWPDLKQSLTAGNVLPYISKHLIPMLADNDDFDSSDSDSSDIDTFWVDSSDSDSSDIDSLI